MYSLRGDITAYAAIPPKVRLADCRFQQQACRLWSGKTGGESCGATVTDNAEKAFDIFSDSLLAAMTGGRHAFARPFLEKTARLLLHVDDSPAFLTQQHDAITSNTQATIRGTEIKGLTRDFYVEWLKDPCASDICLHLM